MKKRSRTQFASRHAAPLPGKLHQAASHAAAGRLDEAESTYRQILSAEPHNLAASNSLAALLIRRAMLLQSQGRPQDALACFDRALALQPDNNEALINHGFLLHTQGRLDVALSSYRRALSVAPGQPAIENNCGVILSVLDRHVEAVAHFERAIALQPNTADFWNNRGLSQRRTGQNEAALASYRKALQLDPNYVEALRNAGNVLIELGQLDEAARLFAQLVSIAPKMPYALGTLMHVRLLSCDWTDYAISVRRVVDGLNDNAKLIAPFELLSLTDDGDAQLRCATAFAGQRFPLSTSPLWRRERYAHDRIRLAYVSGDFRQHAMPLLMAGVFEQHDRSRFECIALSFGPQESGAMRARLVSAFDRFVDIGSLSDRQAAALLRELEVDIAVDLMGFTRNGRPGIFANRGAPLQVAYLGYPGSMGAAYFDYAIVDGFIVGDQVKLRFAENTVCLPDCFQANDDKRSPAGPAPTKPSQGLPESGFVFCSFNNSYKLNPPMFDVWMRLLTAVPGSVLWLVADNRLAQQNLAREAATRGVAPDRLIFAGRVSYAEHLARMQLADLFLDAFPFGAGTTASDALRAGLPLLTLAGDSFASRMAGSLLTTLGLPELVTRELAGYEAQALALSSAPDRLRDLRSRLATARSTSPLFDTGRFVRHLEAAYSAMWARYRRGEPPAEFCVEPLEIAARDRIPSR